MPTLKSITHFESDSSELKEEKDDDDDNIDEEIDKVNEV